MKIYNIVGGLFIRVSGVLYECDTSREIVIISASKKNVLKSFISIAL